MPHRLSRRTWLLAGLAAILGAAPAAFAEEAASLKDTLKAGLKARRPVEFQFIDRVVQLVDQGRLPRDLVLNTFDWARKQRDDIPFPYFQQALTLRAAKIGVTL